MSRLGADVGALGAALTQYLSAFDGAPRMHAWGAASPHAAHAELQDRLNAVRKVINHRRIASFRFS